MMRNRIIFIIIAAVMALVLLWATRGRALALGVHTLSADDAALQQVRDLGAQYAVQVLAWRDIEPTRGEFHWEYTDWLLRAADYYHLRVVARLDQTLRWAGSDSTALNAPPDNLNDYGDFVAAVAERCRGRTFAYIIWNEPNLAREWGNRAPDPIAYTALLKLAAARIRAADPDARIVSAALAPTNENNAQAMDDRAFLHAMYAAGARETFDILAAHPYAFAHPPDDPRGTDAGLNFRRMGDLREIMITNGDAAKPVWITEFGYPTETPPEQAALRVGEPEQAHWTARAYEIAREEMPYVQMFTVWNLTRQAPAQNDQAGYSLIRADGSPKPAYAAVRSAQKESPLAAFADSISSLFSAPVPRSEFLVLAPDIVVHLGGSQFSTPWVPLYLNKTPSALWTGAFYLNATDLTYGEPWTLTMELMQVNALDNRVLVNDQPVEPPYLPAEDFASTWVSTQFQVSPNVLHIGRNTVTVLDSKLYPAASRPGFMWDNLQTRNIVLYKPPQ
jgi:GH35 family endo-1,4-beta-xylanase